MSKSFTSFEYHRSLSKREGVSLEITIRNANLLKKGLECPTGSVFAVRSECSIVNFDQKNYKITEKLFTGTIFQCAEEAQKILDQASQAINPIDIKTEVWYIVESGCGKGVTSSGQVIDLFADGLLGN